MRERYPQLNLDLLSPDADTVRAMVGKHGPNLFYRSVENRLLCCQVRKVLPLQRYLGGLDAWITGLRRDQWATRSDIRKVEIDHDHGAIVKLNPLAEWTEDEVWDYVREHDLPVNPLYAKGFTSIGCAPCTRPTKAGEDLRAGRWWWETNAPKECGIHCAIETGGLEHELRALSAARTNDRSRGRGARGRARRGAGGARDGARRRDARAVRRARRGDRRRRGRRRRAELLEQVLELGLQAGRIRAYYGPGGEQAALKTLRRLPRGRARAESAREVSEALATLEGNVLERVSLTAVAPGAYMPVRPRRRPRAVRARRCAPAPVSRAWRRERAPLHRVPRPAWSFVSRGRRRARRDARRHRACSSAKPR